MLFDDAHLYNLLDKQNIEYEVFSHHPVFTTDEANSLKEKIIGAHSKNLLLRDRKKNFFLVSMPDEKKLDIKALSKEYGKGGLSFARDEHLMTYLGVIPGAVTPYGLINDTDKAVTFILDHDFMGHDIVNFHPLRNDKTLSIAVNDLISFLTLYHTPPKVQVLPCICS
jgi:Ala-tRNA(Pro) deacylase